MEEIYQEKYMEPAVIGSIDELEESFVDVAYQNMVERETYIAKVTSFQIRLYDTIKLSLFLISNVI